MSFINHDKARLWGLLFFAKMALSERKRNGGVKMKYMILVSHGTFAQGLHSVLKMLAGGNREDILSTSLEDGMGADEFKERFAALAATVTKEDEILLLADIIGGSPLTTALEVLTERGMLKQTMTFGGMNLPMALTAALMKDALDHETLKVSLLSESREAMKEVVLDLAADDSEEEI